MLRTLFYRLPRLTVLAILIALAAGIGAVLTLGRQEDPTLVERFGFVLTTMPGADADRIEALLTEPIEAALLELPEIKELQSVSRANISQVNINLADTLSAAEVDDAWTLVRQQVEAARSNLPVEASVPEIERSYIGASTLLISLVWENDTPAELAIMARLAQDLQNDLRNLAGTEEVEIFGLPSEEIRVILDTDDLAATGLSSQDAARLIAAADARVPAGQFRPDGNTLSLEVSGAFDSITRIRQVPLIQRDDGSAVRVGDVANVSKGFVDPPTALNFTNGERSIMIGAFIQSNQRVDKWAIAARSVVASFADATPQEISVRTLFDQSTYTEARLNGLAVNLGYSGLIVFGVLFFILGWRSAIVVGMALPLTICLVLVLFRFFNIPLHQMSVTGLVISLGLLIDNAIVVVDEYDQKRLAGASVFDAIDKSLQHLFAPLAASTLTTALAFVPIASLPGSAGEFIGMIGTSVIFSVCSSFVIAMTIIPAMAGFFDSGKNIDRKRKWWRDGVAIDVISDGYRWTVEVALRFPLIGILVGIVPAGLGLWLGSGLPLQFFPQTDRNQMQVSVSLSPESSISETVSTVQRATELFLNEEGVIGTNWTIGEGAPRVYYNSFNNAQGVVSSANGWIELDGPKRAREIVSGLQARVREVFPDAQFLVSPYEQGPPISAPIELRITGSELSELNRLGEDVRRVLSRTPGVIYTTASLQLGAPKIVYNADETAAAMVGLRLAELAEDLNAELEGVLAGSVLEGIEEIPVRVLASDDRRQDLGDLRSKTIGATPGELGTPISALGEISLNPDTAVITHFDGKRANTIQAFLEPYALPAPALEIFTQRLNDAGFEAPSGYKLSTGGEAEARGDAVTNLAALAIPLILMITGAVALVFNSFRMAGLILVSGALSVCMAFLGIWLFNLPMGFNAMIGALGLFGIAINGSIVVLSQLRACPENLQHDVIVQREIVVDATRHIVGTTLTTMGGFIPLIIAADPFWLPLAASISVGVFGSAILALYFTPSMYSLMKIKPAAKRLRSAAMA